MASSLLPEESEKLLEPSRVVLVKVGGSAVTDKAGVEVLREWELGESARQVERPAPCALHSFPERRHR